MALPLIAAGAFGAIAATFGRILIASFIIRLVSAFGIGLITFTATDAIVNKATSLLSTLVFNGNATVMAALDAGGIFDAVNIILSAYAAVFAIKAIMGVFKRLTFGATT